MLRPCLILVLLLASGCAHMLGPDEALPPAELPVTFQSLLPPDIFFAIEGGNGEITVQDRAITGICHQREAHGAYRRETTITFWIAHVGARENLCQSLGKFIPYRASIGNVPPGTYTVRVEYIGHINSDTYPRPDLEQQVTVR
jgi:hypothetical protein